MFINAEYHVGWRDPNGETIFADMESYSECLDEESNKRKLVNKLPYGYLLGVIADLTIDLEPDQHMTEPADYQLQRTAINSPIPNNNNRLLPWKLVEKKQETGTIKKIIAIGPKATIKFKNKKYVIRVTDLPETVSDIKDIQSLTSFQPESSEKSSDEYYLFFVVNDTFLEHQKAFENIEGKCPDDRGIGKENTWLREIWEYQKRLYQEDLQNPSSIWFLDNRGSFTVRILITEE